MGLSYDAPLPAPLDRDRTGLEAFFEKWLEAPLEIAPHQGSTLAVWRESGVEVSLHAHHGNVQVLVGVRGGWANASTLERERHFEPLMGQWKPDAHWTYWTNRTSDRRPFVRPPPCRRVPGRLTLGLYNCYDPKQWHEIMRITLARVGPVALAFDADVTTFGFPFEQARARGAKSTDPLRTPADVAAFVSEGTSIGDNGTHFTDLVAAGRFALHPFPRGGGFPAKLGRLVATTPAPDPAKATTPLDVARDLAAGHDQLLLFGLGPRGLPAPVLDHAAVHLELTGKGLSMETATALGALPAQLHTHLQHLAPRIPHSLPKRSSPGGPG